MKLRINCYELDVRNRRVDLVFTRQEGETLIEDITYLLSTPRYPTVTLFGLELFGGLKWTW